MYVCKYGENKLFVYPDAPETFDWLKSLSKENKLFCWGCGRPVIFCRCTAKKSHFAHRNSEGKLCDFEEYITNLLDSHKMALKELQARFAESNNPQLFEKLIDRHWTSMTLCVEDKTVAVELLQPKTSYIAIKKIKNAYSEKGIGVLWLFISQDTSCEYESVSNIGANRFFKSNNYIIYFDPENDRINIEFKENKPDLYHCNIFRTSISLDQLTVDTEGKVSKCIKAQYDNWKSQRELQAQQLKEQTQKMQFTYQFSANSPLPNTSLDSTYDEMLHNVRLWIKNVQSGAGNITLDAIHKLITIYTEYRQIYIEVLQNVEDTALKKKLESLLH